jgi:hypothetical protein
MKLSLSNFYHETPPVMRKIGDSLAGACATGAIACANYNCPKIASWCVGGIIVSKFITNCFSEKDNAK